ncbi:unnamed protein product [Rhizopus stolonifer]
MQQIIFLPATCELCGNWLPTHSSSCPRNGVHPSQWCLENDFDHDEWSPMNHKKDVIYPLYLAKKLLYVHNPSFK